MIYLDEQRIVLRQKADTCTIHRCIHVYGSKYSFVLDIFLCYKMALYRF